MDVDSGEELSGQQYDERLGILLPFTWQKVPPGVGLGDDSTDLAIVNKDLNLKKVWDKAAIQANLDNYERSVPMMRDNIRIPDELVELEVLWTKQDATAESDSDWNGGASGDNWSLSGSENQSSFGSATVMPELKIRKREFWTDSLPTTGKYYYMPSAGLTLAAIKTKCGVADVWPMMQPEEITFVLQGGKVSVRVDASAAARRSYSASRDEDDIEDHEWGKTEGYGVSVDNSPEIATRTIPACLHDAISLADATNSATVNASVSVGWVGSNFPTVLINKSEERTIDGSVSPVTVAATTPASVPRSGEYILRYTVEPSEWDYCKVFVEIFDASVLA